MAANPARQSDEIGRGGKMRIRGNGVEHYWHDPRNRIIFDQDHTAGARQLVEYAFYCQSALWH
jgi:hypothetical protein